MSEQRDIICRCEEVTRAEIMEAIRQGDSSLEAIKRRTRAGMGFCQGRTCKRLIAQILSAYYHMPVDRFLPGSIRMPITPISLRLLADTCLLYTSHFRFSIPHPPSFVLSATNISIAPSIDTVNFISISF